MSERYFRLPLGRLETNCYTVDCGGGIAAVIDPGDEPGAVEKLLEDKGLRAGAVLITHGHFDHVGAARALNEKYGCPVWRSDKDSKLPQPLAGDGFYTELYGDGDTVAVGKMEFRVIATPGHSMGSVCLVCGDLLLPAIRFFAAPAAVPISRRLGCENGREPCGARRAAGQLYRSARSRSRDRP